MSQCERIAQWRALIASYKRYRHEFDHFFLYLLFDNGENALASGLLYVPRQLLHPALGDDWDHLCIERLPASIWRAEKPVLHGDTYLNEANHFSSFLFVSYANNGGDSEELPHALRSSLPPKGVIGVKHCHEFTVDCLNFFHEKNSPMFGLPHYLCCAHAYTFNWRGRTLQALFDVLPASYRKRVWLSWLPHSQIFVASLREKAWSKVLQHCFNFLTHFVKQDIVSRLLGKLITNRQRLSKR